MKMVYTKQHKILLQTIMHEGLLNENKAKDLVIKLFNDDKVSLVINHINEQLQPLNMLIKRAQCEITGEFYWVFVSTVLDEVTRFQEEFSKAQLALLRNIFSEIITSSNGCAPSIFCLNLCSLSDVKMSITEAEEFLNDIVNRKWLAYKNGNYYIGVRSITELMPYFRATYENNLSTCCLCKQVIFHGERCNNCQNLLHLHCLKRYAMIYNPVTCPTCDSVFPNIDLSDTNDDLETVKCENMRTS
ncbi:SMC5-SMC6 complex component Non-SMC element 1 [Nomia melanderi]|uniref:SMC5-SMC6 complex component Non-SMC element 1 n=1 Tax=Nomia melanderi TaxID=2448451 RepID=UPI001304010A|nr:non-structural maintenance of chromosomes element 1 homolog [Nomia melanderi]XP_031832194.1 non-structural maintenance of chromosomes element 1 homolog [Nomia melanderi]XP_031832195.1 non-structural maintenance of chromosomes element 1 homolog [Nomia melanderi]XP_031832196.1 non-structural maintenance of chromosomes element 1 homolog [Nomia melanderi]